MIVAGYVDTQSGPFDLFNCAPRAGIWIHCATAADSTEEAQDGVDPNGDGVTSMSVGFCDAQGDQVVAEYGGSNTGFDFTSTGTGILEDRVTGAALDFPSKDTSGRIGLTAIGTPGWQLSSSGSIADLRAYYLALMGETMESVVGEFTLPGDGSPVSVSGLPFTPDLVIFSGSDSGANGGVISIGALDDLDNQWGFAMSNGFINAADLDKQSFQGVLDACLFAPFMNSFGGSVGWKATGTIVAGGFDITQVTPPPSGDTDYAYIAIRDPSGAFRVGGGNASDGVSGLGFDPEAVMMATVWATDQAIHYHGGISTGVAALADPILPSPSPIANDQGAVFTEQDQPEAMPGSRWRSSLGGDILIQATTGGVTNEVSATIVADGFTTSVSGADPVVGWIAMRGSDQGGCARRARPQIYRLVLPI